MLILVLQWKSYANMAKTVTSLSSGQHWSPHFIEKQQNTKPDNNPNQSKPSQTRHRRGTCVRESSKWRMRHRVIYITYIYVYIWCPTICTCMNSIRMRICIYDLVFLCTWDDMPTNRRSTYITSNKHVSTIFVDVAELSFTYSQPSSILFWC